MKSSNKHSIWPTLYVGAGFALVGRPSPKPTYKLAGKVLFCSEQRSLAWSGQVSKTKSGMKTRTLFPLLVSQNRTHTAARPRPTAAIPSNYAGFASVLRRYWRRGQYHTDIERTEKNDPPLSNYSPNLINYSPKLG
jgi:hypothetical protein